MTQALLATDAIVIKGMAAPKECCLVSAAYWEPSMEGGMKDCGVCGNTLRSYRLDNIPTMDGGEADGGKGFFFHQLERATSRGEQYEVQEIFQHEGADIGSQRMDKIRAQIGARGPTVMGNLGKFMVRGPVAFFKALSGGPLLLHLDPGLVAVCAPRADGQEGSPFPEMFDAEPLWW